MTRLEILAWEHSDPKDSQMGEIERIWHLVRSDFGRCPFSIHEPRYSVARLARSQDKEREKCGFNQINTNPPSPSKQPASRAWAEQNKTEKDPVSLGLLSFPNLQTSLASFCTGNMSKHTGKFQRQTDPQKT